MSELVRRALSVPAVRADGALTVSSIALFAWLLLTDHLDPLLIVVLQLFLAF